MTLQPGDRTDSGSYSECPENVAGKCLMNGEMDEVNKNRMVMVKGPKLCFGFLFLLNNNILFVLFGLFF